MPTENKNAIVFWDNGYWWTSDGGDRHGPFDGPDNLDDAITDAKRAGFKIYEVNRTRGLMPAFTTPTTADLDAMALAGDHVPLTKAPAIGAGGSDDGCSACGAGQHEPCREGCTAQGAPRSDCTCPPLEWPNLRTHHHTGCPAR